MQVYFHQSLHITPPACPVVNTDMALAGMDKVTGCVSTHWGSDGILHAHTKVVAQTVLLRAPCPAPGICQVQALSSLEGHWGAPVSSTRGRDHEWLSLIHWLIYPFVYVFVFACWKVRARFYVSGMLCEIYTRLAQVHIGRKPWNIPLQVIFPKIFPNYT